jgi:hypothetical protein
VIGRNVWGGVKGLSVGSEEVNLWLFLLVQIMTESESLRVYLGWVTGTAMAEVMVAGDQSKEQAEQRRDGEVDD